MKNDKLLDAINALPAKIEAAAIAHDADVKSAAVCHSWSVVCSAERYPGTAGWVAALGSILAVIVTCVIFTQQNKAEFASRRKERNRQIDLILDIIDDIERTVGFYLDIARAGYNSTLNDVQIRMLNTPAFTAGRDLAHLTILNWPSKDAHSEFRIYWLNTVEVIAAFDIPSKNVHWTPVDIYNHWKLVASQIKTRDEALPTLRNALNAVRV